MFICFWKFDYGGVKFIRLISKFQLSIGVILSSCSIASIIISKIFPGISTFLTLATVFPSQFFMLFPLILMIQGLYEDFNIREYAFSSHRDRIYPREPKGYTIENNVIKCATIYRWLLAAVSIISFLILGNWLGNLWLDSIF